ncbi:putative membrane lipoprotein lipid attachment site-like protein [Trifolium medium]|uniref:Putative membrane lipoprotein lipid attachment site-like protein n=1 Tax=Trifolium medium TaxID=97028 RepID=A0A392PE33_9FABA|nr:putative membrane lipoprotein lipid attachment site-like protein [Trifolium medium]
MGPRLWTCFGNKGSRYVAEGSNNNITADVTPEEQTRSGPVVVEMFSSQGCTTSPAAELVLSRLGRGDFQLEMPVVVLAFHVDYWDYMGWKDPYGSSQWTVRQKAYVESLGLDTLLTPQVVIQGLAHCLGNDDTALVEAINNAPRYPALNFQVRIPVTIYNATFLSAEQCSQGPHVICSDFYGS